MRKQPVRRHLLQGLLALALVASGVPALAAQGVELALLRVSREEGALTLEFATRLNLSSTVQDALQRGVPVYFVAEAQLWRKRWYWRDERVARVQREWRVAYQPLTGTWRVGLGGLHQTHATLAEALAAVSRSAGWKLVDLARVDTDKRHYLEFSYVLDKSQLPGPMQFGLGGEGDWEMGVSRVLAIEPAP